MKQSRIVITDARFGNLSYHKKFSTVSNFPGEKFLCGHPFNYVEIRRHGGLNVCCPQWNPAEIGNLFDNTLEEIWSGEKAQVIRDTILDGSYSYCDHSHCPKIANWQNNTLMTRSKGGEDRLINDATKSKTPNQILFVVDHSCNLVCPSCRGVKLTQLDDIERAKGLEVIRRTLSSMFPEPHNEYKTIGLDGSGEIFSSELYREVFETEKVFTDTHLWPNLNFTLSTNGTLMTEKIQQKYKNFFDHVTWIEISVDAGNKESYEKVRVGGHWDLLWKNLEYLHDSRAGKFNWGWNIIVQKNNYESIPELIEIAKRFTNPRPQINFATLLNWGTWTEGEYIEQAVHIPSHPEHQKYLDIMNSSIVTEYKKGMR